MYLKIKPNVNVFKPKEEKEELTRFSIKDFTNDVFKGVMLVGLITIKSIWYLVSLKIFTESKRKVTPYSKEDSSLINNVSNIKFNK